jgi:hypothetical protein
MKMTHRKSNSSRRIFTLIDQRVLLLREEQTINLDLNESEVERMGDSSRTQHPLDLSTESII